VRTKQSTWTARFSTEAARLCLEGCARTLSPRKKRLMDPATPIEMAQTWLRLAQEEDPSLASGELTTFALGSWRSAYVPPGKAESSRALLSRIHCVLRHRRKRSQKLSRINCVAATIQLTGWEPAAFDCSVDRRFGDACGSCCAAWCVHSVTNSLGETPAIIVLTQSLKIG
jgi:hypothetical protein